MSLDRLPSGNIRARLMIDGQRYTATFPTVREATDWVVVTRAAAIERRGSATLTVEAYARRWLAEFISDAADLDRYARGVEHHVIPCHGSCHLSAVTSHDVAALLPQVVEGAPSGAADSVRATCRALFADAVQDGLLARSPVSDGSVSKLA